MSSYSEAAQKLVGQADALQKRAMEFGEQAVQWQSQYGGLAKAQELQLKAHELMDKAVPMREEANIYQTVAQLADKEAGVMKSLGLEPKAGKPLP